MHVATQIAPHIAYLRRYARALTGTQADGDAYVRATLEAIIGAPGDFPRDVDARLALYRTFHAIWSSSHIDVDRDEPDQTPFERTAHDRLSRITPLSRQALLLTAMEGFSTEDVGFIVDLDATRVAALVREAMAEIDRQTRARVLIIEDEPIIAMDLEGIVRDLGHDVAGIAITRAEAVALARQIEPGLVLADIQLADASSGIDAVHDILGMFSVPVIFITAFPERLLTGERPEPTFLITKPFQRSTVTAAVAQALFFDSSATLRG
jgi:DNA-directed RNA polymerase specialized sigma24 family protein